MYSLNVPESRIKQILRQTISTHLPLDQYHAFIFGSRVTGKASDSSDIDVGVEGPNPVPDTIMSNLREDIENLPFLYKIDVVDFKKVDAEFYNHAKQKIESL